MTTVIQEEEEPKQTTALVTVEDAPEQAAALVPEVGKVVEHAKAFEVIDEQSNLIALKFVKKCKQGQARVEELFGDARDKAHAAHKAITGAIAQLVGPLKEAEKIYGRKSYEWTQIEKRARIAEELARQKVEYEKREQEKLVTATFMEAAGLSDSADAVLDRPVEIHAIPVAQVARPEGVSVRANWQFRIVDASLLPRGYLIPDLASIGKVVKAEKGQTNIPGVEVFDAGTVVVRGV